MNGILKCFALLAIIVFGLSACGGESSGESSGTMTTFSCSDFPSLTAEAAAGCAIYIDPVYACDSCHGRYGEGTAAGGPVDNTMDCPSCVDHPTLTNYNDLLMPSTTGGYDPSTCTGQCASDVSLYIIEGFIQGKVKPGANNSPAINVNAPPGFSTTEGANSAFIISINSLPADDVTVNITSSDVNEGIIDPLTASHTFTINNWQQAFTVNVMGVDDVVLDPLEDTPYEIQFTVTSNDPAYNAITVPPVALTNKDNEVPGLGVITVNPTSGLVTTEDGGTATFTVVLGSAPTNMVTIGITSNDATEGTTDVTSVVFDANNFNMAQTVTVTGVDDALDDNDVGYAILTAAALSADRAYSGVDPSDVMVTNTDNDEAAVIASFTAAPASDAANPIPYDGTVTLTWVSDGDACTAGGANANGQWAGALAASDSKALTNLTTSGLNQFSLVCTKGGIASAPSTVDVYVAAQPGAPTVNLTANPMMNVPYNGSTTLTWSTVDATTCSATSNPANPAWDNANKELNNAAGQVIANLTAANNTFTLSCTNAGGLITTVNVNVTVIQPNPSITLTANPTTVGEGADSTTLTWMATDLASCTASANPANAQWTGAKGVLATQNQTITGLTETTTFTLNCVGINGANVNANVTVTFDVTSTGEYLYNTETFNGVLNQSCADSQCHGTPANPGIYEPFYPLFDKTALCTKYPTNAALLQKLVDTMPSGFDANQQFISVNCDATCSTKIMNYMFLNFYPGNTTDCEGGALPLPIP